MDARLCSPGEVKELLGSLRGIDCDLHADNTLYSFLLGDRLATWRCSATCFAVSEPQALRTSSPEGIRFVTLHTSVRDFLCLQTNYRLSRIKGNCRQDCWKALQDPSNSKQLSVIRRSSVEGRMNEQRKIHKGPTRTRTMAGTQQ